VLKGDRKIACSLKAGGSVAEPACWGTGGVQTGCVDNACNYYYYLCCADVVSAGCLTLDGAKLPHTSDCGHFFVVGSSTRITGTLILCDRGTSNI